MKKILSILLSIIFLNSQIYSFPTKQISVLLPNNNSAINNSVSLSCLLPADSSSSVIPAKSLGGNLSEINTKQSLSKLNRDISTTQELTKSQTTRALNINTTIDLRLLTKEGRKDIINDLKNADKNSAKALTGAVGTVISTGKTIYDVTTKEEIGIKDAIDEWKANQKELVNQNKYDRKTLNELSKGKTVEEITEATKGQAKLYYDDNDEAKGFRQKQDIEEQNSYINTAQTDITNTKEFINTLAHENSHIYTENETVSNSVGSYANTMWAIGNIFNLTSIDTSGNITSSQWYSNNYQSSLLNYNTQIAGMIPKQNRNERIGSDIIAIYRNAKQKYSKEIKEPEIRPTNEYYLNSVEQNISLFADIDLMSVSNTVGGVITKIVSGNNVSTALTEQANMNLAESYSNIGNPQERLADLVFSNNLVESANRDLENGRYITGTIKGLIATSQTALIFTGLGESVAGIRTVAGTSGYNTLATNATSTSLSARTAKIDYYVTPTGQIISTDQKAIDNLISKLDVSTPKDKAVFYSNSKNQKSAIDFIEQNKGQGYIILEKTPGGNWLQKQQLYGNSYKVDKVSIIADMYWGTLSKKYASQASGTVNAFVEGADKNRVFWKIEYPTIKNVSEINVIKFLTEIPGKMPGTINYKIVKEEVLKKQ